MKREFARTVPRQDSPHVNDPRNRTDYHPDQVGWSWSNLPDILYQFKPEGKSGRAAEVPLMGYPIHGRLLRNLPVLPDTISSAVEEYRVEAWMRLDRRIHLKDITERMHPAFRVNENALQQRGVRFRQSFNLIAWDSGNKRSRELEVELAGKMMAKGIDPSLNSTRGITPGLINPAWGEHGGRIPLSKYYSEEGRLARGRKAKISRPPTQIQTRSEIKVELKELTSLVPKVEPHDFTCLNKFVPFEDDLDHEGGALPVIRGEIPDDELPTTVNLQDLDLSCGIKNPERQPKPMKGLQLIGSSKVTKPKRAPKLKPAAAIFLNGLCTRQCYHGNMVMTERLKEPEERFRSIQPILRPFEGLQTPSMGIHATADPIEPDMFQEEQHGSLFDRMLEDYYAHERYVTEMPKYSSF